jgi:hypothetical protein
VGLEHPLLVFEPFGERTEGTPRRNIPIQRILVALGILYIDRVKSS